MKPGSDLTVSPKFIDDIGKEVKARLFDGRGKLRERLQHTVEPAWRSATKTSQTVGNTTHISQGQVPCNARG
jgi:hypothetical protein